MPGLAPAAFGRLCVETLRVDGQIIAFLPAAFGRLCVETAVIASIEQAIKPQPPSGGCVLKRMVRVALSRC